jgi:catechol-2,3-dioxygenase
MELDTPTEVAAARERLIDAGVDVIGVTDHGFVQSIYFFDPNGLRLELTARMTGPEQDAEAARKAHGALRQWTDSRKVHG